MNIVIHYKRLPENTRMVLTAVIGASLGFITYEIIYFLNPVEPKASSSWFLASAIGIARQHGLHRWLTFSQTSNYWKSLKRAYIMYSFSIVVGLMLNWLLTEGLSVNHRIAWGCCLVTTSVISLFFLKKYVFKTN